MTTSRQSLKSSWQRLLHAAGEQLALLSAAEQTRLSWAQAVKTVDEIPPAYRAYLLAHLPGLEACLPAVLSPTFRGFLRRENEKLVFAYDQQLFVLEQTSAGLLPLVFPFAEIHLIEVGAILLKAWMQVSGLVAGQISSARLYYNSVTQYLFDPLVAQLREALSDRPSGADLRIEQARFDPLRAQHFKFMSYARKSLQPGQRVAAYHLQPEMSVPRWTVLGRPVAMRILDTAHLCILTDSELIVIRDDPASLPGWDHTRYGGIWDYLPLCRLRHAALEERPGDRLALIIQLPGDDRFEVRFSAEHRTEAERFCAQVQQFRSSDS